MSRINSIFRNLRLILSREIAEYVGEVENRVSQRSDAYEQAVDARIGERFVAIETRIDERSASFERRIEDRANELEARIEERFKVIDLRLDEKFADQERRLDERASSYESTLDRRIDERLNEVESRLDQRFDDRSRGIDNRLDDRLAKIERHLDERFGSFEQRTDDRLEQHERKVDAMIRRMSNDIVERSDIMLQIFEQRLDQHGRELRALRESEKSPPTGKKGAPAQKGEVETISSDGDSAGRELTNFRKLANLRTNLKTKVKSSDGVALYHQILDWKKVAHEGLDNFTPDEQETVNYILSFLDDPKEIHYVKQHLRRFVATLQRIPPAQRSTDRLLELGSLSHLAPAIRKYCGYKEVYCADYWESDQKISHQTVTRQAAGGKKEPESYTFELRNFNVERDAFPYADGFFQVVLCCELIEHLQSDPMHMLWECNRVLEDQGYLLLTTPNIASCRGIEGLLVGCAPYLLAQYNVREIADQHNREYAPYEIGVALAAAGFTVVELETEDVWMRSNPAILDLLKQVEISTELRSDNIFALARKTGAPVERYPKELYID